MENEANQRQAPAGRTPGTGFSLAGIIALLAITSATAIYPTYSSRNEAISYLGGAGAKTEIFWDLAVIVVGVLWLASTYLYYRKERVRLLAAFLSLAGIGFILVGSSPWNVYPVTHYAGANLIFLFGALSCLAASKRYWGGFGGISLAMGLISLGAYISGYMGGDYLFGPGGIERLIFYPILLWSIAFGGYLSGTGTGKKQLTN